MIFTWWLDDMVVCGSVFMITVRFIIHPWNISNNVGLEIYEYHNLYLFDISFLFSEFIIIFLTVADTLLDDFMIAENSPFQSDIISPVLTSETASTTTSPRSNHPHLTSDTPAPTPDGRPEISLWCFLSLACF